MLTFFGGTSERGMIVTIYRDPNNLNSNDSQLQDLQNGDRGPFYGP